MSDPLGWIDDELGQLKKQSQYRSRLIRESPHVAGKVQVAGMQLVNLGANDYLGFSSDARLVNAVKQNSGYVGWGSGASPLIHGHGTLHARLENELAEFEETEAALLFSTGFAANLGVITSLTSQDDVIFSDERNHASIIDGCRLSRARTVVFRHNDIDHLRKELVAAGSCRRKLIVTDGLFSMEGDLAELDQLAKLRDEFGAMLMVDEAHATGVFGSHGKGVAEHFLVKDRVDVTVGTLSKALGCHGGFVAGSQKLIDWITNTARSYIFSTAPPDASCIAGVTALEMVRADPTAGGKLLQLSEKVRVGLRELGFNTGKSQSQIIPIIIGDNKRTMELHRELMKSGYFVPGIRPPAVPTGQSMLRVSLNANHTEEMVQGFIDCLNQLCQVPQQSMPPTPALSESPYESNNP